MRVTRLDMGNLRRFERASLLPGPGINLLTGDNGAGKTSVLEALHLMAYGRSFRGRVRDGLVRAGAESLEVYVEWREEPLPPTGWAASRPGGRLRRAGLRHSGQQWQGRLDGEDVAHLGDLCAALVVVTVEPGITFPLSLTLHPLARRFIAAQARKAGREARAARALSGAVRDPRAVVALRRQRARRAAVAIRRRSRRCCKTPTAANLIRVFRLQERLKSLGKEGDFKAAHVHVVGARHDGRRHRAWCALRGLDRHAAGPERASGSRPR